MENVVVTGITGQDGAYLAENLLEKGYRVFGTFRRGSSVNFWRIEELGLPGRPNFNLIEYDLLDMGAACRLVEATEPVKIYNLAAQSFVGTSFEQPTATAQMNAIGPLNLLEAIRIINPAIRFYQASSSEMFGATKIFPQNEDTPFYPRSPYGVSKLFAHWMTINYRESFGIFGASGILFNHESPLRGGDFVTRKITNGVARITLGQQEVLELGNLDARRDWGYAREYVEGIRLMLEADTPSAYVLATGVAHTVRSFVDLAFKAVGTKLDWRGKGVEEVGRDAENGKERVRINPSFFRPAEVDQLYGDYTRAQQTLGWSPTTDLEQLCNLMVEADLRRNQPVISHLDDVGGQRRLIVKEAERLSLGKLR